jgi:phosphatidate cytidylyltransferase
MLYLIALGLAGSFSGWRSSRTVEIIARPRKSLEEGVVLAPVALALWSVPPLFGLVPLAIRQGTAGLALLVVLSKIGDSAGYFVGRSIGKRHPFPTISPGKTVAGCVASLVAGVAAGACLVPLLQDQWGIRPVLLGIGVGLVINVAAQLGDLAKSWVKRRAGVKDSSRLLGPSGGVLDVVDSLLLTTPLAVLIWPRLF